MPRLIIAAVLFSRASQRLRIPAPAFFLLGAAAASNLSPRLASVSGPAVGDGVTVALALILFDGGMQIGWRRFRKVAAATAWVGLAGTFVTAAAAGLAAHSLFSFSWRPAFLLGTAPAPTDPAVVFSVLGQRQVSGRSGVLIESESGANDPVGIGSGFLAVFAAGIVIGDERAPYKREIARSHSALASLAELTAFVPRSCIPAWPARPVSTRLFSWPWPFPF